LRAFGPANAAATRAWNRAISGRCCFADFDDAPFDALGLCCWAPATRGQAAMAHANVKTAEHNATLGDLRQRVELNSINILNRQTIFYPRDAPPHLIPLRCISGSNIMAALN
jgi:hypothetical protein